MRTEFYGSEWAVQLGLQLLTTLNGADIYAENAESIDALQSDCKLLLANVSKFPNPQGYAKSVLKARVQNILSAAQMAAKGDKYVVIW